LRSVGIGQLIQWHAQPGLHDEALADESLEGVLLAGSVEGVAAGLEPSAGAALAESPSFLVPGLASAAGAGFFGAAGGLRKSVAYHPEPFSWNPAAVTCLRSACAWQLGHSDKGGSESLCKTSCVKPQASQR